MPGRPAAGRPQNTRDMGYDSPPVGAWRSLVAHLHGVQGVASSNLVAPTNYLRVPRFRVGYTLGYTFALRLF